MRWTTVTLLSMLVSACAGPSVCEQYVTELKAKTLFELQSCLFYAKMGALDQAQMDRCDAAFQFVNRVGLNRGPIPEPKEGEHE